MPVFLAWSALTLLLFWMLRRDLFQRLVEPVKPLRPWHLAGLLCLAFVVASFATYFPMGLCVAVALFVGLWMYELNVLMHAGDDAFPGRYNKPLWVALMVLAPPVGLVLFRSYREAHWAPAPSKPPYGEAARDFS